MPQQQGGYLSTDPNAGTYLSNDPSAGKPIAAQPSPRVDPRKAVAKGGQPIPYSADVTPPDPSMLPLMGGVAAGVLTEGLGLIPMLAGQFAGGAAGSAGEDAATGQPISGSKAIRTGAEFAGTAGVLRGLSRAKDAGRALWTRVSGEARPAVREAIMSRGGSGVTPADIQRVHQEARATDFTPGTPAREPSQILDATGKPAIQGAAEQPAQYGPLWDAYHSMKNIRSNIPSLSGRTATGATVGGGLGYMGGGEGASRVGAKLGALTGLLTHPSIGLNAGKALYGTPNIITQGAQAVNPAVATETMRQLVALMLSGKQ